MKITSKVFLFLFSNNPFYILHQVVRAGKQQWKLLLTCCFGNGNKPPYWLGPLRAKVVALTSEWQSSAYNRNGSSLQERMIVKDEGITLAYLKPGQRADDLLKISEPLNFHMKKRRVASEAPTAAPVTKQLDPAMRSIHENCYEALRDVLKGIAEALNVNTNAIMNMQALRAMAASLPETPEEMLAINHVTQVSGLNYD